MTPLSLDLLAAKIKDPLQQIAPTFPDFTGESDPNSAKPR
jgi:hypothetical protein